MVGITWDRADRADGVTAQVRTRSDQGWSDWESLDIADASGDPTSRAGTEPLWVNNADGVAARISTVDGQTPDGLKVAMIDPGQFTLASTEPAIDVSTTVSTMTATTAVRAGMPDRPNIVTRSEWGADPALRSGCDSPYRIPTIKGVIVHHSAGSNSYSKADAASVVRGIYAYHTTAQGWCDIGYNFLVDKYGTIYEGRKGSIEDQVRGSHAGNWDVNVATTGVSMIGNYDTVRPTTELETSMVKLIAWRLASFGLPARGTMTFGGTKLKTISGHRDVYNAGIRPATSTACPGRYGYAWLGAAGGLRDRVAARMEGEQAPVLPESVRKVYANHKADLGQRISDVKDSSVKGLRFVNYNKGRIYLHAGEASALWGLVDDKYRPLGKSAATLGFPTSSIRTTSSATFANFSHGRIYRHSKKAFSLWGDIESRHQALEGVRGVLGRPTSSVKVSPSGRLRANFGQARVYAFGGRAYALWGNIFDAYVKRGATRGVLGVPTSSVEQAPTGRLRANFANGRVYAYGGRGYALWGAVFDAYVKRGATRGVLGVPTSNVQETPSGRRRADFANGRVYAYGGRGYALWGPVFDTYVQRGATRGVFGIATTDVKQSSIDGLRFATFANGRIYAGARRTFALSGAVFDTYRSKQAHNGLLGRPRTHVKPLGTNGWKIAGFWHGHIFAKGDRVYLSHGAIDKKYTALGGARGKLGYPETSVYRIEKGQKMRFRHGFIKWFRASGKVTVHVS